MKPGRVPTSRPHWRLIALAAGLALPVGPAAGQMAVVPVRPMSPTVSEQWIVGKPSRKACIDVTRIAGAIVVDARAVDVVMRGGKRWRLTLAQQCPQLSYYGGFYYKPARSGQMCAGQDQIISRAGGACRVSHISLMRPAPTRR